MTYWITPDNVGSFLLQAAIWSDFMGASLKLPINRTSFDGTGVLVGWCGSGDRLIASALGCFVVNQNEIVY